MWNEYQSVYIDKLADKFNNYNNANHRTIKIKPVDIKSSTYIDVGKGNKDKDPTYEVIKKKALTKAKAFLQKVTFETGWKKFLWLYKTCVFSDLKGK